MRPYEEGHPGHPSATPLARIARQYAATPTGGETMLLVAAMSSPGPYLLRALAAFRLLRRGFTFNQFTETEGVGNRERFVCRIRSSPAITYCRPGLFDGAGPTASGAGERARDRSTQYGDAGGWRRPRGSRLTCWRQSGRCGVPAGSVRRMCRWWMRLAWRPRGRPARCSRPGRRSGPRTRACVGRHRRRASNFSRKRSSTPVPHRPDAGCSECLDPPRQCGRLPTSRGFRPPRPRAGTACSPP